MYFLRVDKGSEQNPALVQMSREGPGHSEEL